MRKSCFKPKHRIVDECCFFFKIKVIIILNTHLHHNYFKILHLSTQNLLTELHRVNIPFLVQVKSAAIVQTQCSPCLCKFVLKLTSFYKKMHTNSFCGEKTSSVISTISIIFFVYVQTMLNSHFPWYSRRKQTITLKTGKLMSLDAVGALSYEEEDERWT